MAARPTLEERRASWKRQLSDDAYWRRCFAELLRQDINALEPSQVNEVLLMQTKVLDDVPCVEGRALLRLNNGHYACVSYFMKRRGRKEAKVEWCLSVTCPRFEDLVAIPDSEDAAEGSALLDPLEGVIRRPMPLRVLRFE